MADRAGQPDRAEPVALEEASDSDYRVQLQQRDGHRRIVQIHLPGLDRSRDVRRYRGRVDLQPERERLLRAHPRPDAAVLGSGNRFLQAEYASPNSLVAERLVAEDVSSFC